MLDAAFAGMTAEVCDSGAQALAFSRRISPELCKDVALEIIEGAGNAGWFSLTHGPRATRTHAAVTTGSAEITGIPCAMVLTLMTCSSRGPGFFAPVIRVMPSIIANLAPASGRQNHTFSPSATASLVQRYDRVHRSPPQRP
ncbi:hypothetical protein [Bradyrhizobium sp.]|uniref:hypothetical protein n=1 Tax=Bradyrhizobium sp. TaxID=376 RepID=UPI0025C092B0|nr:hypothetical protein [Bradyrhizobium sp.]